MLGDCQEAMHCELFPPLCGGSYCSKRLEPHTPISALGFACKDKVIVKELSECICETVLETSHSTEKARRNLLKYLFRPSVKKDPCTNWNLLL